MPTVNPRTGYSIAANKKKYLALEKECGEPNRRRSPSPPRRARSMNAGPLPRYAGPRYAGPLARRRPADNDDEYDAEFVMAMDYGPEVPDDVNWVTRSGRLVKVDPAISNRARPAYSGFPLQNRSSGQSQSQSHSAFS
jgi:hypothetical protein